MTTTSNQHDSLPGPRARPWIAGLTLATIAFAAHGWSLGDGLFLDDHLHQAQLRTASWRPRDLVESTTIEPQRWLQAWWQTAEVRWDYARPLTMAWMKAIQTTARAGPPLRHAGILLWHLLCCLLTYRLCLRITANPRWSWFGAVLFAVYPHHAYTVGWLAAQNVVIQTTLTVAAVCCYLRATGLPRPPGEPAGVPPLRRGDLALTAVLGVGSMLARENAVILPVLLVALDLAYGGWTHLRARRAAHLLIAALTAGYVVWRMTRFDSHIPVVYFRRPADAAGVAWLLTKLLHYLACVVWEAPMVIGPTAHNPLTETPGDVLLMFGIVAGFGTAYVLACRGRVRGFWVWPLWIVLSILPVLPIMATPHSAYLPAVGFAIALVLKPAAVTARRAPWSTAAALWMMTTSVVALVLYRVSWQGVVAAEQYTIAQSTSGPAPDPGTHVFLINLPLANIYLPLNLQEAWDRLPKDLPCHVLTFSPDVLQGPRSCRIEQLDDHRFALKAVGRPYFSGVLGAFLTDALRPGQPFRKGEIICGPQFEVCIDELDAGGVSRLTFTFARPLSSPSYRFLMITHDCPGAVVQFAAGSSGAPTLACAELPDAERYRRRRARLFTVLRATARVIHSGLYLTAPDPVSPVTEDRQGTGSG